MRQKKRVSSTSLAENYNAVHQASQEIESLADFKDMKTTCTSRNADNDSRPVVCHYINMLAFRNTS